MKGTLGTLTALTVALLAIAPAHGDEQTRESYVARLEPICKANRDANKKILSGVKERVESGKLKPAGKQFIRVSRSFGGLVTRIHGVSPPVGDDERVERWIKFLRIVQKRLRKVGVYLEKGQELRATHEKIFAERSGNAANNVSFIFGFRYCRISRIG